MHVIWSLKKSIDGLIEEIKAKIYVKLIGDTEDNKKEMEQAWKVLRPIVISQLQTLVFNESNYEYLVSRFDEKLQTLAGINPIIAYELNGKQNIKERIQYMGQITKKINDISQELVDEKEKVDLGDILFPIVNSDILNDLDSGIRSLTSLLGKKIKNEVEGKLKMMDSTEIDRSDFEDFSNKFIDTVEEHIVR